MHDDSEMKILCVQFESGETVIFALTGCQLMGVGLQMCRGRAGSIGSFVFPEGRIPWERLDGMADIGPQACGGSPPYP